MSSLRLILTSLLYHWRTNLAVACGVAVGTAVLDRGAAGGRLDARQPATPRRSTAWAASTRRW